MVPIWRGQVAPHRQVGNSSGSFLFIFCHAVQFQTIRFCMLRQYLHKNGHSAADFVHLKGIRADLQIWHCRCLEELDLAGQVHPLMPPVAL